MKKLEFGYHCKDIVTGFEGILKTRGVFITGCDRVALVDGDKEEWFDIATIITGGSGVFEDLQKTGKCNMYDDIEEALHDFGILARDVITGYEGKVVSKAISISGDISYGLSPKFEKDNQNNDAVWFDEGRLEVINTKKDKVVTNSSRVGGAVPTLKYR